MQKAPRITLFQFPGTDDLESVSPFCLKAHRILRRKGLAYETEDLFLPNEVRKVNPVGKLPAITYDGRTVGDSAHIARFLEARHPDPALFPKDEALRARNVILEDWADESLYFMNLYVRWFNPENAERCKRAIFAKAPFPVSLIGPRVAPAAIRRVASAQGTGRKSADTVKAEFNELMAALDQLCAGDAFLLGSEPYLCDIAAFSMLRGLATGLTPDAEAIIASHARLAAWMKRVDEATSEARKP